MWCIRKKNMNEWENIILQEDKTESMTNLSGKITIYSKITYHLTESDKTFDNVSDFFFIQMRKWIGIF